MSGSVAMSVAILRGTSDVSVPPRPVAMTTPGRTAFHITQAEEELTSGFQCVRHRLSEMQADSDRLRLRDRKSNHIGYMVQHAVQCDRLLSGQFFRSFPWTSLPRGRKKLTD